MGYAAVHHRKLGKPTRLETFSKNVLIGLNTIFIVFGFILFIYGVGGRTSTGRDSYVKLVEKVEKFNITPNILFALGIVSIAMGLYGLHGIKDYCKATIYTGFLLFLSFTDLTLGVYSTRMESNVKIATETSLISSLHAVQHNSQNVTPSVADIRDTWDLLQAELKCCGVYEYRDWYMPIIPRMLTPDVVADADVVVGGESATYNALVNSSIHPAPVQISSTVSSTTNHYDNGEDFIRIPHSCFKNGEDGMDEADFNSPEFILENVYGDGCLEKIVADLDIDRVQRIGVIMACLKILAVICAIILTCHLKGEDKLVENHV